MKKAKRPGTPVNETIKRSIRRNMRRGVWGSRSRRPVGTYSCEGPTASMTGLDLGSVSPNGYSTLANGAWAWHVMPDCWFERWVPKPRKGEPPVNWLVRVSADLVLSPENMTQPHRWALSGIVEAVNSQLSHLDWVMTRNPH